MSFALAIAFGLHQLATIVWVGGMFFAHMALRPAAHEAVKAPDRLVLMLGVFRRFFPWVWVAISTLWLSGLWAFLAVFQGQAGLHVHAMMGVGTIMTAIFVYLYAFPYRRLKTAVQDENWSRAAAGLALIRRLIAVNLALGLITALFGSAGRYVLAG
jgi:uncharacterized membrane protein